MTTYQILTVQADAIARRDVELLQHCWWALGYDNRAAFCPVHIGEQRRGIEVCERWFARRKEAA